MKWRIRHKSKILKKHGQGRESRYWSNEFGWTSREHADLFTDEEEQAFNLPIGGQWEKAEG